MKKYICWFIWGCIGIVLIELFYFIILFCSLPRSDWSQFGDSFGALNSLFTGLAFAGVIVTIIIQLEELKTTREELRKSIDAQEKSQKALNDQLKIMQSNHKFDLLNNYLTLVKKGGQTRFDELIQNIITQETEKIFFDDEYKNLVRPNLIFKSLNNAKRPPMSQYYEQEFTFENTNSPLIDLDIEIGTDIINIVKVLNHIGTLNHGDQLKFKVVSNEGSFKVPIKFKGQIVQNRYEQILELSIVNKQLSVKINEPKLIEKWNS